MRKFECILSCSVFLLGLKVLLKGIIVFCVFGVVIGVMVRFVVVVSNSFLVLNLSLEKGICLIVGIFEVVVFE